MSLRLVLAVSLLTAGAAGCVWYLHPKCDDGIKNGHETDVDCGGGCGVCALGQGCGSAADCGSGACAHGSCVKPPCANGVQDGAETDVDCGGGTCRRCAGGRHCNAPSDCFNGTCQAGVCASLRTISFGPATAYASGYKTYVMAAGLVDGDAHLDLVAANEQGDSVRVFLGVGDGTFHSLPEVSLGSNRYPTGVALGDVNHDGHLDVVTANYHGDSVSVLLGGGDGTLGPPAERPTESGAETSNLALGDLNGDGYLDVIASNPHTGSASLFLSGPGGVLSAATRIPIVGGQASPFSVAMGDFDGDGHVDVAVADNARALISVRLGRGDGTLGDERTFPEGGIPAFVCVAADVDLDGHLDLVCANRGSNDVSVLLGRGDGAFSEPVVSPVSLPGVDAGPYAVAIADFNADGVPDVVTPNYRTSTASVLLGVGNGAFDLALEVEHVGTTTYGAAAGDFDGDGHPDLAVCNADSGDVRVMLNTSR